MLILIGLVVGWWRNLKDQEVIVSSNKTTVQVQITGAVRREGVYRFRSGTRLWEALRTAGGILQDANPEQLNLAEPIKDGQKIAIPFIAQAATDDTAAGGENAKVSINSASIEDLDKIPGIGKTTAEKIVTLRDQKGGIASWDDLGKIPRMGKKAIDKLKNYLTLE